VFPIHPNPTKGKNAMTKRRPSGEVIEEEEMDTRFEEMLHS
jgi:hypothetical protein